MTDFTKFISQFPPSENTIKPDEKTLSLFKDKLPEDLISFWNQYGFGNYGNGMFKVINPQEYGDALGIWVGRKNDWSRIPVLISGFGDIFYYRKISETDEDVSVVDLHYRKITVCTDYISYSFQFFMEDYITNREFNSKFVRKELFNAAVEKCGALNADEIFFFAPALIMGGGIENINIVEKGIAAVHQQLLFQMGS